MSYQKVPQEPYPPPGYGTYPPPGYPSAPPQPPYEGYPYPPPGYYPPPQRPGDSYQGYFNQGYPPPPPPPQYQVPHCEHHHNDGDTGCTSFLRGWYVNYFLCCCSNQ
ncbi:Hypothetical predicted protein [Olea europaea subsp. europaea]|uniref:Uncharacterized protein n=1 Tax=Olea europaea subsp. europaea TaxID=158383 RepID=A0A8S0RUZ1_OLEEU|nr:Hypothetical predicted protein [Olea europaea subsp. europaea]